MYNTILFDTTEYLDQIVQIIDTEEKKNFIDTSLIIAPPMATFDPTKNKYVVHDSILMSDILHYHYFRPEYNTLTKELKKHVQFFSENIADLIDLEFMITPSVYKELDQSEKYMRHERKNITKSLNLINKPVKMYTSKNGNNGKHEAEYQKRYSKKKFNREKNISEHMNQLLRIEHNLAKEIKANSSRYMDELRQIKTENNNLYQEICSAVYKAFEQHKIERLNSKKNHENSKDHRILSEIILYSHATKEKATFFTGDSDFYGITKFLAGKTINSKINPDVTVIQRMMDPKHKKMPYFKKIAKIKYNYGFMVERF